MTDIEITQLKTDLIYLAKRQRVLEDGVITLEDALLSLGKEIGEWTEFMSAELLRQGIQVNKYKRSNDYFKESLKDKFKKDYEKFETLFSSGKKKRSLIKKYD